MEKIYDLKNIEQTILGQQDIRSDTEYRLLQFCTIEKINGLYFLYNRMTGKFFLITDDEYRLLSNPCKLSEASEPFIREWCIVPMNNDDTDLADQFITVRELLSAKRAITSFTILPTTDCNARCFYYYEMGIARTHMTEQTARDVAEYIINKSNGAEVSLRWFGGEPLFNRSAIDTICKTLSDNGIKYHSSMISNAYLFDGDTIKSAVELWNLKRVQITLDGTAENYNRIKAYYKISDKNPFKTVTDNIENITRAKIRVSIRLNLSEENFDDLSSLIDWLDEGYSDKRYLTVYFALLYDIYDADDDRLSEAVQKNIRLNDKIFEKGLNNKVMPNKLNGRGCMAQNDGCMVISPTGTLGKCEHFVEGEKTIGSIYSEKINTDVLNFWKHQVIFDDCKKCPDYIACGRYDSCPNFKHRCDILRDKVRFDTRQTISLAYEAYINGKEITE